MEHCDNLPSTLTIAMPRDNRYLLTDKEMILLSDFAMLANPLDEFQRQVAEKNGALQSCLTALCGDNVEMKTQTYLGKSPELQITCTDAHKVKTLKRNLLDLALEHNKDSFIHFNRVLDVAGQPYDNRFIIKLKHGFDLHQFLLEHGERNLAQKSCPGSSSS
jgi:methyltransferase-like protein